LQLFRTTQQALFYDQIGREKLITFRGKQYKLGNRDDYQFVKQLVFGSPLDIEGECRFSDYFPIPLSSVSFS